MGRRRGEVVLYDAAVGNHTPTMLGDPGCHGLVVPVQTLDECVREWNIDRIDLMKIDVEGYEPEVFAGAARTLADGKIKAVLCEFNAHWLARAGTSPREMPRAWSGKPRSNVKGIDHAPSAERLKKGTARRGRENASE